MAILSRRTRMTFQVGDRVRWIYGSVGLTGVVVGFNEGFVRVSTNIPPTGLVKNGVYDEHPLNLEKEEV